MTILIHVISLLIFSYVIFALIIFSMQSSFLYHPMREINYTPKDLNLNYENVTFITSDNLKLNGWYIPSHESDTTVLFCHGNGGNMMHVLDSIYFFNRIGLNCFTFDYQGFGKSEGNPNEEGTYKDAQAAYNWLLKEKKFSSENIIIFGRSLGGSVAAHLAARVKSKSVVIESCFTSYVEMGKKLYPYLPVRLFAKFDYDTLKNLKKVKDPVMIIHSKNDEIVPYEFGLQLFKAANEPKKFVEIYGNHNDGFLVSEKIYKIAWENWLNFLNDRSNKPVEIQRRTAGSFNLSN